MTTIGSRKNRHGAGPVSPRRGVQEKLCLRHQPRRHLEWAGHDAPPADAYAAGLLKAAVQIPLGLIDAGLKIGAHFAPEVEGVDMSSVMDALHAGVTGKIIDVTDDEDGEHVEIYVE